MGTPIIEYWRSRLLPREIVYWRRIDHTRGYFAPDFGTPGDAARMLQYVRTQYGRPVAREVVRTEYGTLTRLVFPDTGKVFRMQRPVGIVVSSSSQVRRTSESATHPVEKEAVWMQS